MNFSTLNFVACLALHQNRRDSALGLTHVTTRTRGLLWYYNVRQRELITEIAKVSFRRGVIQQAQGRMNEIMSEVHHAKSHDEAVLLLAEARKLKKTIKDLTNA